MLNHVGSLARLSCSPSAQTPQASRVQAHSALFALGQIVALPSAAMPAKLLLLLPATAIEII